MGHYREAPSAIDERPFYDTLAMYYAAQCDEQRRAAYLFASVSGKAPDEIAPAAFPEGRGEKILTSAANARLDRMYARYARQHDCTIEEAREQAPWRWRGHNKATA